MERLVEVMLSKVNILSILDCYYRLFSLIYISYDPEGITIQGPAGPVVPTGSCEDGKILATTIIPRDSFEHYECKESMCSGAPGPLVIAVPLHLGKLGGRCVSIKVLKMDSWRVKNVFKSNNGVSYEAISSYMFKLTDRPKITEGIISFEWCPSTRKYLSCIEDPKGEVEVELNEGVATFKVDIFRISKFTVGDSGEPYCKIPIKSLKLLNKFLGTAINNSKIEFCKLDGPCGPRVVQRPQDKFLFLVDKEHYWIDIRLTTTKA